MKRRAFVFALALILCTSLFAGAEDDIDDLLLSGDGQKINTLAGLNESLAQTLADLKTNPSDYRFLWRCAALHYFRGDFYTTDTEEKKKNFTLCKEYADKAVKVNPKGVAGHYWLGVGMAKWAEYNGILYSLFSADDILNEMTAVIKLNPRYFKGLPFSIRASVYALAPGVISVGDWDKAREDIKVALDYGREYRPNYLLVADIYIAWGEWENAKKLIEEGFTLPYDARITVAEDDCLKKLKERKAKVDTELAKRRMQ